MKKLIACMLCALLLVAAAACIKKTEKPAAIPNPDTETEADAATEETEEGITGGWAVTENEEMTDELRAIFEKAMEGLVGVDYQPIACLGTQIVAGTNYCFLAKGVVVHPDAAQRYMLVYVYEDLSGNATVMNIADLPIVPNEDGTTTVPASEVLMGGWYYEESCEITEEIGNALSKATENMLGAGYIAIANLGSQVVAGINHCVLCRVTPVTANPVSHYALVYIYENIEGGAELLQVIDLDVGALCTYGE